MGYEAGRKLSGRKCIQKMKIVQVHFHILDIVALIFISTSVKLSLHQFSIRGALKTEQNKIKALKIHF